MEPSVFIIVEDNADRIRFLLTAIANNFTIPQNIRDDATLCLKTPYDSKWIKIIYPVGLSNFNAIDDIMKSCSVCSAICFLDLGLGNSNLDNIAAIQGGYPLSPLAAGRRIGETFSKSFGRLLVQASIGAMSHGPINCFDNNDYFVARSVAAGETQAKELLDEALSEYRIRYQLWSLKTKFHEQNVLIENLNRFLYLVYTNNRYMMHEHFQGDQTSHNGLITLTGVSFDSGNYKTLFELDKPFHESSPLTKKAIQQSIDFLKIMNFKLCDSLSDMICLPCLPAFSFLIAVKIFQVLCVDKAKGRNFCSPSVSLTFDDITSKLKLIFTFTQDCSGLFNNDKTIGKESARDALKALKQAKVMGINERISSKKGIEKYYYGHNDTSIADVIKADIDLTDNKKLILSWPI